jgi:putative CocE/NonD family hydrolase
MPTLALRLASLCLAAAAAGALARAQQPNADRFAATDVMIPMRDGVKLHTIVLAPKDQQEPLPFLLKRTPYGVDEWQGQFSSYLKDLADDGYIFVFQDLRGRYRSEGTFVMQRALRAANDATGIDEGTDAYDTIEWLLHHVERNNGRAGMLGISYDGWTTIMAAVEPHPALRAISPQASPADMWLGDDFHHNGAFRLSYGFEYAAMMETSKTNESFKFDRHDVFDWYLRLGSLKHVDERVLLGRIPTWTDFVAHADYDSFWQRQTIVPRLTSVKVPTLNVAGWWDQEDFFGPLAIYRALEQHDDHGRNFLVVGPWNHGGWAHGTGNKLGAIPFASDTAAWFRKEVQAKWFAYWLKDKGKLELPEALTFESGNNEWRRWPAWPPADTTARKLYLHADGLLSFDAPTADAGDDAFVSDPAHPVPYRHRPIQATYGPGSKWREWLVEDQRFVRDRADVLTFESPVLDADLTIAGDIGVQLYASTTGTDADWIVKLIDVWPEQYPQDWNLAGFHLMVANEVFRGRYRNGFERGEPVRAGEITAYAWSLHTQDHTFLQGHRIAVQVQSTWFPLIDRNPQKFVPNIFAADDADFTVATHRVFRTAKFPSHVTLPVVAK